MAEEIDLTNEFKGMGASQDAFPSDDVGLNSRSAAMKYIDAKAPEMEALYKKYGSNPLATGVGGNVMPEYNTNVPAPTMTGNKMLVPPPSTVDGVEKLPVPTGNDIINNYIDNLNNYGYQAEKDPFKFTKNVDFDARNSKFQNQFYERYKNSWDYDKLGFTPFRDNEKAYNENSNWFKDMYRASGQWATLTGLGFKDALGFGDLSDTTTAAKYEKAMAIGQSSAGGVSGFTTNLFLNSGYTVGIMAELAVEEIGLLAAEAALGIGTVGSLGTAAPATIPAMAATGGLMAARFTKAMGKIGKAWKTATSLGKTLANFNDINKARKYFNQGAKAFGKFVNPAENITDFYKNYNKLDGLKNWQKTAKGFGAAYRDIRNVRLAWGEGGLEGGMVELEMRDKLYEQFVAEHNGRTPTTEEAQQINMQAAHAGKVTGMINAPVIMLSNKLTFDGLVRGKFAKLGSDVVDAGLHRKLIFQPKQFAKGVGKAFVEAPSKWALKKRAMMNIRNPKLMARSLTTYAKANWAEGLQELAQETIAGASEDYYLSKYSGNAMRGGHMSYMDAVGKNLGGAAPMETFLSGFLMGGMIHPVSNIIAASTQGSPTLNNMYLKFTNKEEYNKVKEQRDKTLKETVDHLNDMYEDPAKYFSPDMENLQEQREYQKGMVDAQEAGDQKTYYDLKNSSAAKHILTALRTNKLDTFIQRMEELKQYSEEETQETFKMTKSEFTKQMDNGIKQAKEIERRYEIGKKKYPNPFNPDKFKKQDKDGNVNPAWAQETIKSKAWDNALEQMIFTQNSFDNALQRKTQILSELKDVAELDKVASSEFNHLESVRSLATEISNLKKELQSIDQLKEVTDPELLKVQENKKKKLAALEKYQTALQKNVYEKKDDTEELTDEEQKELVDAFVEYSQVLAENEDEFTNIDALKRAGANMIDAHFLSNRAKKLNDAVNILLDPQNFYNTAARQASLMELIHKNKKAEIEKSLQEFLKLKDTNDMLGQLADELEGKNMFVDPEALSKLIETGEVPKEIYYINDSGEAKARGQVAYTSPDYAEAIEIFKNYAEHIHGIVIGQDQTDPFLLSLHRDKLEGDKRTYKDYAEQFGFDPESTSSEVPLVQVLEAIADPNNEFSTPSEKELAAKLMEIAHKSEKVTFVNNSTQPGKYNKNQQTVIDARYSSNEFDGGPSGAALETTILKQEVTRRTTEALENDKEFANKIEKLRKEAEDYYKSLPIADRARLFGDATKIPMGLVNAESFVQAAMGDSKFQQMLATIKTSQATDATPTWLKFIKSVLDAMAGILGSAPSGTVLNATVDVITSQIDGKFTATKTKKGKTKVTRTSFKGGSELSVAELQSVDDGALAELVVNQFIADNQAREEDGNDVLLKDYDKMSPAEIMNTQAFANYLKNPNFQKKERVIREYKVKAKPEPAPTTTTLSQKIDEAMTVDGVKATIGKKRVEKPKRTKTDTFEVNGKRYRVTTDLFDDNTAISQVFEIDNNGLPISNNLTQDELTALRNTPEQKQTTIDAEEVSLKDVTESEYNNWVDNGAASLKQNTIYKLAQKVMTRADVTQEEQAMLADKDTMSKVNELLREMRAGAPRTPNDKMRRAVRKLGFDPKGLNAQRMQELIWQGLTKQEVEAADVAETAKTKQMAANIAEFNKNVQEILDDTVTYEQYETLEDRLQVEYDKLTREERKLVGAEFSEDVVKEYLKQKLEDLAFSTKFEDINIGELVILNNKFESQVVVIAKTADTLTYKFQSGKESEVTIKADQVEEKIKYRYSEALEKYEDTVEEEEITEEDNEQSNESVDNLENISNSESVNEDINESKSKTDEELDDDFLDDIC